MYGIASTEAKVKFKISNLKSITFICAGKVAIICSLNIKLQPKKSALKQMVNTRESLNNAIFSRKDGYCCFSSSSGKPRETTKEHSADMVTKKFSSPNSLFAKKRVVIGKSKIPNPFTAKIAKAK